jgi:hypothetical protein
MLTDQPAFEDFVSLVLTNGAGNKAVNFGHALLRHLAAQQIWRKLFRQKSGRKFSSVVIRFVIRLGCGWIFTRLKRPARRIVSLGHQES